MITEAAAQLSFSGGIVATIDVVSPVGRANPEGECKTPS
jgi:hypothetical protein